MTYHIDNDLYCVGDIHGQPQGIEYLIESYRLKDSSFILLGDVGMGFADNHRGPAKRLQKIAEDCNGTFYLFRGNHDNPASFTEHKQEIEESYSRVKVLQDFDEIITKDGERCLVIGGSVSIDRQYRVEGKNWWRGELIDYANVPTGHYDIVFSHTGPTPPMLRGGSPFFDSMIASDPYVKAAVEEENRQVERIVEAIKPKAWYNGHFHVHEFFEHGTTRVYALDINEIFKVI